MSWAQAVLPQASFGLWQRSKYHRITVTVTLASAVIAFFVARVPSAPPPAAPKAPAQQANNGAGNSPAVQSSYTGQGATQANGATPAPAPSPFSPRGQPAAAQQANVAPPAQAAAPSPFAHGGAAAAPAAQAEPAKIKKLKPIDSGEKIELIDDPKGRTPGDDFGALKKR
jgi:hypothetical protein